MAVAIQQSIYLILLSLVIHYYIGNTSDYNIYIRVLLLVTFKVVHRKVKFSYLAMSLFQDAFSEDTGLSIRCASKNRVSDKLSKIINALGWRQRFSNKIQCELPFLNNTLIIKQIPNGEEVVGTGAHVWPAAIILAKYLEKQIDNESLPLLIKNKRCLDLGSGTGIIGICAALLEAEISVCSDVKSVFNLMTENCDSARLIYNQSLSNLKCNIYEWDDENNNNNNDDDDLLDQFDVVFVSDCILPQLYPLEPLIKTTKKFMKDDGIAIFAYEARVYPYFNVMQRFKEICNTLELEMFNHVPLTDCHNIYVSDEVQIFYLRKKN